MLESDIRTAAIRKLHLAFPLGASDARRDLVFQQTIHAHVDDLSSAIDELIRTNDSPRAPTIAKLLVCCSDAATKRRQREQAAQLPFRSAVTHQVATGEDTSRLHELGRYGLYWDGRAAAFVPMTSQECGESLEREFAGRGGQVVTRADINAAWLELDRSKPPPRRGPAPFESKYKLQPLEEELPF